LIDLGTVRPGSTIRIPFSSFDKEDGSAITMTNYAASDILVYADGSTTERASTSGYTATTDFDGKTGKHLAIIDLADNTTAGFFKAGSEYLVAIDSVTVDAVTTGGWIARFRIGYAGSMFDTTIASLTNQTSFTLTVGPAEDDALNGRVVIIHDIASAVQCGQAIIADYTGSTKTVTLVAGTTFTAAAGDNISIMDLAPLMPSPIGSTLTIASGAVALAAGAITAGTITDGALSASKFGAGFITAGSFSGNAISAMAVTVGATAASAIASAVQALPLTLGSTTRAALVDEIWDEPKAGHTTADTYGEFLDATVSGISGGAADTTVNATAAAAIAVAVWAATRGANNAAGSFGEGVASVQGNVTGSVASVTAAVTVGATSGAAIAAQVTANSIGAVTLGATSRAAVLADVVAGVTAGSIGPVTVGATSRAAIVDEVWDEPKSGHTTADTYGDYLDSTTGAIKTDTAAIKAKTDSLTFAVAGILSANIKYVNDVSVTGNGQSGTEWGPGS
jgi:hypothetical protein